MGCTTAAKCGLMESYRATTSSERPEMTETATKAPKKTAAAKAPKAAPETHGCACGCGEQVERTFRQGHDQRLISLLAEDVVYSSVWDGKCMGILKGTAVRADQQEKINLVATYMRAKLTDALAVKFERAAARQWELQKGRDERADAKEARKAAAAAKPKKAAKKADETPAARADLKIVKPTASNDDIVDEDVPNANGVVLGAQVKVRVGKRVRNAKVTGMSQLGKVTAVTFQNAGKDVVKTGEEFEIV